MSQDSPNVGDQVELTFEGEVAEVIKPPHGGSIRYRIDTDATAFPLVVYRHHVEFQPRGDR